MTHNTSFSASAKTASRVYFDHNATTPLIAEARAAMGDAMALGPVNPSSVHAEGRQARAIIDSAREQVAALVGGRASNVVFTSGATEAANWIMCAAWDVVFLSAVEHPCLTVPAAASTAVVVDLPVTGDGQIDVAAATASMAKWSAERPDARMVLLAQMANNETGVIQPVAELAQAARAHGITVVSDAVQAAGKVPIDIAALGVDALMISGHKMGGPTGVGAVVFGCDVALPALIAGGGQERGRRCGTENVIGIAGFGAAAAYSTRLRAAMTELSHWRERIEMHMATVSPSGFIIAKHAPRLANTTFFANVGVAAETAVIKLDLAGFAVSSGSACSSGKTAQSTVLTAMGLPDAVAKCAIRISLGHTTTGADVDRFCATWSDLFGARDRASVMSEHTRQVA